MQINIEEKMAKSKAILEKRTVSLLGGKIEIDLQDILKRFYGSKEDMIVLGGTLIEGNGNSYSDLDVLVLTNRIPNPKLISFDNHTDSKSVHNACKISKDGSRWSTHDYYHGDGLQIEFQYTHLSHFYKALDQIQSVFGNLKQLKEKKPPILSSPSSLDHNYKEMFHRLLTGIPIQGIDEYVEIVNKIPVEELCMAYYAWTRITYSEFKDILGAIHSSHLDQAVFMATNTLVTQMRALSHLVFNTNDKAKWTFYYVNQFPKNFDPLKISFQTVMDRPRSSIDEKMQWLEQVFDLIDAIFIFSNNMLDQNFTILNRKDTYNNFLEHFSTHPNSTHPQILRQFAFVERFCSKKFIPLKLFINSEARISPCFKFE